MFRYLLVSRGAGDVPKPCCGEVKGRLTVRERAHHPRAPPDLAQDALETIQHVPVSEEGMASNFWQWHFSAVPPALANVRS
jgi:hypothetical protein